MLSYWHKCALYKQYVLFSIKVRGAYSYHWYLWRVNETNREHTVPRKFQSAYFLQATQFFVHYLRDIHSNLGGGLFCSLEMNTHAKPEHPDSGDGTVELQPLEGKEGICSMRKWKKGDNQQRRINRRSNYKKLRFLGWHMMDTLTCCQEWRLYVGPEN